MNAEHLTSLAAADDADHWDCAAVLDWAAEVARVKSMQAELECTAGCAFELDDDVQDAAFFAELAEMTPPRDGTGGRAASVRLAIRFSGFGRLVTIWSSETERLPAQASALAQLLEAQGYRYVPVEVLDEKYEGALSTRFPQITTWWSRFFDYT